MDQQPLSQQPYQPAPMPSSGPAPVAPSSVPMLLGAFIAGAIVIAVGVWAYTEFTGEPEGAPAPSVSASITPETVRASGIIKLVYSKSGKNYIDIDYVELNPNWAPGGTSGPAYQNNNPQIRTFEISPSAKFVVGSPATDFVTFSEFQNFFSPSNPSYQKLNPWDIVVADGRVVEIVEHFLP